MNEHKIFEAALSLWGSDIQRIITIEELSELQKELCKSFRFGADRPHIADGQIMLEQMMILYECRDDVAIWRQKKVSRLRERLMCDGEQRVNDG